MRENPKLSVNHNILSEQKLKPDFEPLKAFHLCVVLLKLLAIIDESFQDLYIDWL
jgi:hypothetical protein